MKDLQDVFNDLQNAKKEMKEIRKEYRDALSHDAEYETIVEKMKDMRELKKNHEIAAQQSMGKRWEELEDLKVEVKTMQEMLSDISLSTLMKGETVVVRDQYDALYEPVYTVSFRKSH